MRIGVLGTQARDLVNFRGHLLSELAKAGHEAFGIAPGGDEATRDALAALGATYVPIRLDRTGLNPFGEALSFLRLWRTLRGLRLDLLLCYELKSVAFGTLAARLAGVPRRYAMITGRGTTLQGATSSTQEKLVRAVVTRLYRMALPRTQGVLFQNQDDCDFFGELGMLPASVPRRIINGSGVDLDHFARQPLPEGTATFLFVGRLLKNKGVFELVEACRILARRGVPFHARMLGPLDTNPNGITAGQLEAWVGEGSVAYLGELADVRPALAAAHVMVLPSYGEGTPRSVLEALAVGRAVVTTDAPGCKEVVAEGVNGHRVPVGDATALADAMEHLARDPELIARFAQEGRRLAERKYDVRLVTADIIDFMNCGKGKAHGAH
ncbi:glycosyltransferase family 4 protein [Mesoterricola silvestris]|uniref:Glycosyl transferase n=1 Tax=Mesoterricola silvestris TaxID=2927979 RepID=A0AA48GI96_9BACT|nr:glycosyltransferase family 4 protein [Mesoterricola silvestris]BDU71772.1 glycosyl transferase [Mesoterricola silvestris]